MAELAMLADIQRMVYPERGHPSTARHGAGQRKFANVVQNIRAIYYIVFHTVTDGVRRSNYFRIVFWLTKTSLHICH